MECTHQLKRPVTTLHSGTNHPLTTVPVGTPRRRHLSPADHHVTAHRTQRKVRVHTVRVKRPMRHRDPRSNPGQGHTAKPAVALLSGPVNVPPGAVREHRLIAVHLIGQRRPTTIRLTRQRQRHHVISHTHQRIRRDVRAHPAPRRVRHQRIHTRLTGPEPRRHRRPARINERTTRQLRRVPRHVINHARRTQRLYLTSPVTTQARPI